MVIASSQSHKRKTKTYSRFICHDEHQSFPSLSSWTRIGESLGLRLVSDSVLLYRVELDSVSESDSNFLLWEAQACNLAILWGLLCKGIRDSDSKYRVSRCKTRLGLGLGLVILEGTKLGLGIVEVSCKVSDSESRLENSDPGNSALDCFQWTFLPWDVFL